MMSAFQQAWGILKGLGSERGVKGTACPQCGAQYDPDENQWTSSVGYATDFKQPYMCHDCDINFDGPAGTGEWAEHNPDDWQVGETEGMDMVISPVMQGKENLADALGAFMQDRANPGLDEAKRAFLNDYLKNYSYGNQNERKAQITNAIMEMSIDEFTMEMERKANTPDIYDGQFPSVFDTRRAAKAALDILNSMGGMDEGMA